MTEDINASATAATPAPAAAPARRSFFRSTTGKVVLVGGALLAIGAGVAVAQGGRMGGMGGMGPMMGGMMGGRGFERFCAADVGYVTQRLADGATARLSLTDAQKPALNDLRATIVRVAGEAKKACADKPDMATATGRLAAMQQRLTLASAALTEVKPKFDAFYAALSAEQKKTLDEMRRPGGRHGEGRGWRHGQGGGEQRGWRQGEGGGHGQRFQRQGMFEDRGFGWQAGEPTIEKTAN